MVNEPSRGTQTKKSHLEHGEKMKQLENRVPFIATIISNLIILLAIGLVERSYLIWLAPLFLFSLFLGANAWVITASFLLSLLVALGEEEMQTVVGQNYQQFHSVILVLLVALSLLQIIVYVIDSQRSRPGISRSSAGRNTIFGIFGITAIYVIFYYLFRKVDLPSELQIPPPFDQGALAAWFKAGYGLAMFIIEPISAISIQEVGLDSAYQVSISCFRFLFSWPFTWAALFAAISQMLSVRFSLKKLIYQFVRAFVGMVFIGGLLAFVIELVLSVSFMLASFILPAFVDISLETSAIMLNVFVISLFAAGILTSGIGAGVGASWGVSDYE